MNSPALSETEGRILRNIEPWLAGQTVIIIAHRLSTLRKLADEIVIDDGEVAERGTHAELIAAGGWYSEMVQLQSVSAFEPSGHLAQAL